MTSKTAILPKYIELLTKLSVGSLALFLFTSMAGSSLSHIFIAAPAFYALFLNLKNKNFNPTLSQIGVFGIVAFGVISILARGDIEDPVSNLSGLMHFAISLLTIGAYRATFNNPKIDNKKFIRTTLTILLVTLVVANINGIIGLYTQYNPLRFRPATDPTRSTGMYRMAITYGYGIQLMAILLTGLVVFYDRFKEYIQSRSLLLISWLSCLAGLYFSFTRGALLGFLCALPVLLYRRSKKVAIYSVAGFSLVFVVVVAIVLNGGADNRFLKKANDPTITIRVSQYMAAWEAFKEKPVLGYGFGNFRDNSIQIKAQHDLPHKEFAGHAHNNFLEMLASTGFFGFLAFLLFTIAWWRESWGRNDAVGLLVPSFIFAFVISGQFQNTAFDGENMFLIMAVYALSQMSIDGILSPSRK